MAPLLRLARLFRRQWPLFAAIAGTMLTAALLQLPAPLLTMQVIDTVNAPGGARGVRLVHLMCATLVAVLLLVRGVGIVQRYWLEKFRFRVTFGLQQALFSHTLKLPLGYHLRRSHGYLMSRVYEDPERIQGVMADSLLSLLRDALTLAVGIGFLFYVHWRMALLAVLVLPVLAYLFTRLRTALKADFREVQERSAQVSRSLGESLAAVRTVKVLALERTVRRRFAAAVARLVRQRFLILRKRLTYENQIGLLTGVVPVLILWYGALEIAAGRLTVGEYIAFNGLLGYLFRPAEGIVISLLSMQGSLAAVERVFEVLDAEPETYLPAAAAPSFRRLAPRPWAVELDGVGFRYQEDRGWVFRRLDLQVRRGELLAIAGPSGAGKSTLLHVVPRLVVPEEGRVRVHGVDQRRIPLERLRREASLVSLETQLFATTVAENLSLGRRGIGREELDAALRLACADEFVRDLPAGLDTRLGETGLDLSAGQRQRLLIARAVLHRPSILILDEATAFLDPELELRVLANLRELTLHSTLLCVSHRPSVAEVADRVLVLDGGLLAESAAPRAAALA